MKVFFFTEGGKKIGFGHLTRCLAISETFKAKGVKTSFIINGDDSVKPLFKENDFKILNWVEKIGSLKKIIKESDIVFVDSYLANKSIYLKIKRYSKLFVCIDDNNRINYPANIIINGNVNAKSIKYLENENKNYLLGSEYAPIRKEFWNVTRNKIKKEFNSILLTFGSGDVGNLSPLIINILKKNYPNLLIKVVIGSGYKNIEEIKKIQTKNVKLIYSPDVSEFKKLLENIDAVISASGQTVNEILRVNKPGIIISVADNQLNTFKWLGKNKILFTLKKDDEKFELKLVEYIELIKKYNFRLNFNNKRFIVDGKGSKRIVDFCLKQIRPKILFLTNNENSYQLANWLKNNNEDIKIFSEKLSIEFVQKYNPSFLVSYNYKYIIPENILLFFRKGRAINLHISYLPWNKGSNPNFWSFVENTKKGVTIHILEKGLDTGEIIVQKLVKFNEEKDTLASSYTKLHKTIVNLFIKYWYKIKFDKIKYKKQSEKGSYHIMSDFNKIKCVMEENDGWNISIKKLKELYINKNENY